ncbi:MAG: recombination protein O N-terminal domain-containing protein, partial [Sinomicrobium sp.]|nr:recombination protein O N-terminal domain-containing protein [Sinomicrobium sp.]
MLKGVLASRKSKLKAAYFQPLTLLDIIADHRSKSTLHYIREAKISYPYKTIHTAPRKNAVILFVSEILNQVLQEEEENQALFHYIKEALQWLDAHE